MASVADVITYIGIRLAVLGIIPIFYTFLSILTQRSIRSLLHRGHNPPPHRRGKGRGSVTGAA